MDDNKFFLLKCICLKPKIILKRDFIIEILFLALSGKRLDETVHIFVLFICAQVDWTRIIKS